MWGVEMTKYSALSETRLATCHPDLQRLFRKVLEGYDHTVICGHRDQAGQDEAFRLGHSKKKWPEGKHNSSPSRAIDVAPYPLNWEETERFYHFAGYVKRVAEELGIKIRFGGDWDGDLNFRDEKFMDLVHFELVDE